MRGVVAGGEVGPQPVGAGLELGGAALGPLDGLLGLGHAVPPPLLVGAGRRLGGRRRRLRLRRGGCGFRRRVRLVVVDAHREQAAVDEVGVGIDPRRRRVGTGPPRERLAPQPFLPRDLDERLGGRGLRGGPCEREQDGGDEQLHGVSWLI